LGGRVDESRSLLPWGEKGDTSSKILKKRKIGCAQRRVLRKKKWGERTLADSADVFGEKRDDERPKFFGGKWNAGSRQHSRGKEANVDGTAAGERKKTRFLIRYTIARGKGMLWQGESRIGGRKTSRFFEKDFHRGGSEEVAASKEMATELSSSQGKFFSLVGYVQTPMESGKYGAAGAGEVRGWKFKALCAGRRGQKKNASFGERGGRSERSLSIAYVRRGKNHSQGERNRSYSYLTSAEKTERLAHEGGGMVDPPGKNRHCTGYDEAGGSA